jgi:hypothetical protein
MKTKAAARSCPFLGNKQVHTQHPLPSYCAFAGNLLPSTLAPRSITMFNMGFGDCFLIRDDSDSLFVDCGTLSQVHPCLPGFAFNAAFMLPSAPKMLISHFHLDHFGLIGSVPNLYPAFKYQTLYIRGMAALDYPFWVKSYLASLLVLLAVTKDTREFVALMNIPGTLLSVCASNGKIITVAKGSPLRIGQTSCTVLWPPRDALSQFPQRWSAEKNQVDDFYQGLWRVASNNGRSRKSSRRFIDSIKAFWSDEGGNGTADFKEAFLDNYALITRKEQLKKIAAKVSACCQIISSFVTSHPMVIQYIDEHASSMKKIGSDVENSLSIVFHCPGKFLFTGDAPKEVMKQCLLLPTPTYRIIKIPHHGTKNYYFNFQPYSVPDCVYLIPNSSLYRKTGYEIDRRYTGASCHCLNCSSTSACKAMKNRGKCSATKHKGKIVPFESFSY